MLASVSFRVDAQERDVEITHIRGVGVIDANDLAVPLAIQLLGGIVIQLELGCLTADGDAHCLLQWMVRVLRYFDCVVFRNQDIRIKSNGLLRRHPRL